MSQEVEFYNYKAEVVKVIDGDTVKLKIDLGFNMFKVENFRLSGINAPEPRGEERPLGLASKEHLTKILLTCGDIYINSSKHGKYRWLAEIYTMKDGKSINEKMVLEGYAERYEL